MSQFDTESVTWKTIVCIALIPLVIWLMFNALASRYTIVVGGPPVAYVLNRWTGEVQLCRPFGASMKCNEEVQD